MKLSWMKLITLVLTYLLSFSVFSKECTGKAQLSVNGDNGHGDSCEFYKDVYRTHKAMPEYNCRIVIVPPAKRDRKTFECRKLKQRYQRKSWELNQQSFFDSLEKTVESGIDGSVVTLTDHGSKVPFESCEVKDPCYYDAGLMDSQVSMGQDDITATEMREKIRDINNKQSRKLCGCIDCECSMIKPMIP